MFRVTEAEEPRAKREGAAAAGVAAAALGGYVAADAAPKPPPPRVRERFVDALLRALASFLAIFARREETFLRDALDARGVRPDDVADALAEEVERNREFAANSKARLRVALEVALGDPDPAARRARVQRAVAAERRYATMRTRSAAARSAAAADRVVLRSVSPDGAFWQLDPLVREHTPGCLLLGGKAWPWSVLDRVYPPRHGGCPCRLRSVGEAIAEGLMRPGEIHDPGEAAGVMMEAEEEDLREALVRTGLATAERVDEVLSRPRPRLHEGEAKTGVMVAFYPSAPAAASLALPRGEKVEEIHLTLAFLGRADEIRSPEGLAAAVRAFAASAPPIEGEVAGTGIFTAGPEPVTYASFDAPGLPTFREILVDRLRGAGYPPRTDHGFTPHLTLAYEARPLATIENLRLRFERVSLVVAGERTDFELTGEPLEELFREWMVKRARVPGHEGEFAPKGGGRDAVHRDGKGQGAPGRSHGGGSTRVGKPATAADPVEARPTRSGRKVDPSTYRGDREERHARRESPGRRLRSGRVFRRGPKKDDEKQRTADGSIVDFDADASGTPTRELFGRYYDSEDNYGVPVEIDGGKHYVYEQPDRTFDFEEGVEGYGEGHPRSARHDALEESARTKADGTPRKPVTGRPRATFLSGGPASGKGGMEAGKGGVTLPDGSHFDPQGEDDVPANPDDFAAELPDNEYIADRGGNGRSAVHEQASTLAKRVTTNAIRDRHDLFVDVVGGGKPGKFEKKLDEALDAGYEVPHIHVLAPRERAETQAEGRYQHAKERYEEAKAAGAPRSTLRSIRRSLRRVDQTVLEDGHRESSATTLRLLGIPAEGDLAFEERPDGTTIVTGAKPYRPRDLTTLVYAPGEFKDGTEAPGPESKKLVAHTTPDGDVVVLSVELLGLLRKKAVS